ncbi:MAG: hypothetical protein V4539_16370 [Bacteroidota bacterium]
MEFNITNLDPVQVLQTAYTHAMPVGDYGIKHHLQLVKEGKAANWLSIKECNQLLKYKRNGFDVDYHNGKALKISWKKDKHGRLLFDASRYDLYQGKYRFLEALLFMFDQSEIIITKLEDIQLNKNYPVAVGCRTAAPEMEKILSHLIFVENAEGNYWQIDTKALMESDQQPFLNIQKIKAAGNDEPTEKPFILIMDNNLQAAEKLKEGMGSGSETILLGPLAIANKKWVQELLAEIDFATIYISKQLFDDGLLQLPEEKEGMQDIVIL